MNTPFIMLGLGLLSAAVLPTPDDVTVISPAIQAVAGTGFLIYGLTAKGGK